MAALAFLESKEQCNGFLRKMAGSGTCYRVVALAPEAMEALDVAGVSYTIPEEYCLEQLVKLGSDNFHDVEVFCKSVDRFLQEHSPAIRTNCLSPASSHYYYIKVLKDALTLRLRSLSSILEAERPDEVLFFTTAPEPATWNLLFLNESIYSHLIPLAAQKLGISVRCLGSAPVARVIETFPSPWWKRAVRRLLGQTGYQGLHVLAGMGLSSGVMWGRDRSLDTMLVVSRSGDVMQLLRRCSQQRMFRLVHWTGGGNRSFLDLSPLIERDRDRGGKGLASFQGECNDLWQSLRREPWFRDFFLYRGVDFWPVVESRVRYFFIAALPDIFRTRSAALRFLERYRPAVVLTSGGVGYRTVTVLNAAQSHGTPVASYQHGGFYGYCFFPMHHYADVAVSDHFGVYGPAVAQHFDSRGALNDAQKCTVTPLGSPALDALQYKKLLRNKRASSQETNYRAGTVMYVPTNFSGNHTYLPGVFPDTLYFQVQKRLVDLMGSFPAVKFLVKLASGNWAFNPIGEYVARRGYANVKVFGGRPFTQVMDLADGFLIDWPSTALLQALTTDLPIVVLADRRILPMEEKAVVLLKQAVTYSEDTDSFLKAVEAVLERGSFEQWSKRHREEFLGLYGTNGGDGRSAERAVAWLRDIADHSRVKELQR